MTSPEHIAFETMYLEFPASTTNAVSIGKVLEHMNSLGLIGVAIEGAAYGVDTQVIAKVAVTTHNDESVVLIADEHGNTTPGAFTGSICERLARALDTELIADEYVRYAPGQPDEAVDFVELDPRRQAIDHPAGFPNEWRLSPHRLALKAVAFSESNTDTAAHLIASDCGTDIQSVACPEGRIIAMPHGVAQLPEATNVSPRRTVLFAQGGLAKYAVLQVGHGKKKLVLTIANLPQFRTARAFPDQTPAAIILDLMKNGALVQGSVAANHPQFPVEYVEVAEAVTGPEGYDEFFQRAAGLFGAPAQLAEILESEADFPNGPDLRVAPPTHSGASLIGQEILAEQTGTGLVARISRHLYARPWLRLMIGALWLLAGILVLANAHVLGQTILPLWCVWAAGILFILQGVSESLQAILHLILRRKSVPEKG